MALHLHHLFLTALPRVVAIAAACVSLAHAADAPGLFDSLGKLLSPAPQAQADTASPARQDNAAPAARNLAVAATGKRKALVIGNDAYQNVSKLDKAGNDATAMARELKAAGFEVVLHRDLDFKRMVNAVEVFTDSITGGDQVVVFFAGHGVQIKTGSYLLPIDIEASSESQVEKTSYGLADLTDKLSDAKASFALVMVDACRNNPLKSKGRSIGAARGLSAIEPPKGHMVVYSASKGQQALDRLGDDDKNPNGVFTREFIARMKTPGVRIEDLMREVQDAVEAIARVVSHEQRPAIYNEARGSFYFFGPTTVQVTSPTGTTPAVRARTSEEIEDAYWDEIKNDSKALGFEEYLKQYPEGRYAGQARIKLGKLKPEAKPLAPPEKLAVPPAPTPVPPVVAAPAVPDDPEAAMWKEVKDSGAREYLDAYLKQYPKGKYAALARVELKKLDDKDKAQRAKEEAERKAELARIEADRKAVAEREKQDAVRAEQDRWAQAKNGDTLAAYAGYLEAYPQGRFAALAKAAQQKLTAVATDLAKRREEERKTLKEALPQQQLDRDSNSKSPSGARVLWKCTSSGNRVLYTNNGGEYVEVLRCRADNKQFECDAETTNRGKVTRATVHFDEDMGGTKYNCTVLKKQ